MQAFESKAHTAIAKKLWHHPQPTSTHMWGFLERLNQRHGLQLSTYAGLYEWSTANISTFWREVWDVTGIQSSQAYDQVCLPSLSVGQPDRY
jgi:acetoacetyl-CoA synthetase